MQKNMKKKRTYTLPSPYALTNTFLKFVKMNKLSMFETLPSHGGSYDNDSESS
jgi:hypothetical protein